MWRGKQKQSDSSLLKEIQNELGPVYSKGNGVVKNFFEKHPKTILTMMFVMIGISMVFAVIIYQKQPAASMPSIPVTGTPTEISNNFGELQRIQLKQEEIEYWTLVIEDIIKKESISTQDSMMVETAIKELEILNNN